MVDRNEKSMVKFIVRLPTLRLVLLLKCEILW